MPETHPLKKAVNRFRAIQDKREGPARKDQEAAPIADAVAAFWERDTLAFAIPAHGGGRNVHPEFAQWAGIDAVRSDVPMGHGVDNRRRSWQVQSTAQELFADAVGAKQVLFSTNGSSMSVHVAILTVAGDGGRLVMARNGHKSAFAGLVLAGAEPIYVEPVYDEELEIAHPPTPAAVAAALDAHPAAAAAMIFTPSYYGTAADVAGIANACHTRGKPLVTDDAWGLDYAFSADDELPESALDQGSDLAIGSVHKTLSGLSQTSVLSVGSGRIDTERLQLCFELQESTSASTLLLSSIDGARRQFVREGYELLAHAISIARHARERITTEIPELPIVAEETLASRPGVTGTDPTHLMIETGAIGLTGYQAADWLLEHHQLDFELIDHRRILALFGFGHDEGDVSRLVRGLRALVDEHGVRAPVARMPPLPQMRTQQRMRPRDAFFAQTEAVRATEAAGRVTAELITPYPPGVPIAAPGEVLTQEIVRYLEDLVAAGGFVEGASDPSLSRFRVVAE